MTGGMVGLEIGRAFSLVCRDLYRRAVTLITVYFLFETRNLC